MGNIWKKYNIWISSSGFLLAILAAWFFVVMPIRASIEANADDMQKKMIDNELVKARISKIPDMENMQKVFEENRDNLKVILNTSSEVDFIKQIEALAEETGNKIELKIENKDTNKKPAATKTPDPQSTGDIIGELPGMDSLNIQMSLEGNYAQAANFLHKLENMNYYVNVVSLDMAKAAIESGSSAVGGSPFVVNYSGGQNTAAAGSNKTAVKEILKSNLEAVVYLEN